MTQKTTYPKVWNSLTVKERKLPKFTCETASMTVPDQSMSIRQIMQQHVRGIPAQGFQQPFYDEEDSQMGINPKTLDLIDKQEMLKQTKRQIWDMQQELASKKVPEIAPKELKTGEQEEPVLI